MAGPRLREEGKIANYNKTKDVKEPEGVKTKTTGGEEPLRL